LDNGKEGRVEEEFLTVQQIARSLNLSSGRIYQLIAAGDLPATRIGRRAVRIPRTLWEAWVRERLHRGGEARDTSNRRT
jgi:excisionase family DNA binding protein